MAILILCPTPRRLPGEPALLAQSLQQGERRIAVRRLPQFLLIGAQRRPSGLADLAVDFPDIIAHFLQPSLHFPDLGSAELALANRPRAAQGARARRAIAEQGDAERVGR